MHIAFTETVAKEIERIWGPGSPGRLKLVYDSEGRGCAVSGVPTLWLVDETGAHDITIDGSPYSVLMDKKHEVFFEERMTVDYVQEGLRFVLKSSGQIYNAHMSLIDKRQAVSAR
ncbi:hypothetical protein LJK87_08520 [Paenibacillus sp. P25]|nr:hypothetical protein LJK87_08520 [Paenibacillus sp. P25]